MAKSNRVTEICRMIRGNQKTILDGLFSNNPYLRMDAILWLTYHKMKTHAIIEKLRELKNDEFFLMGFTVGNYAIAALEVLGVESYTGNDEYQKKLNMNFLPTEEMVKAFLIRYE